MSKVSALSFFFPAYNEEENVERLLRQAQDILPKLADKWEIIPVNDGSRDNTREIIERFAKGQPNIRPVHHKMNKGYGAALISGCKAARYEFVFFTDGDLQFDLNEISLLIDKLEGADLVLGYRKNRKDPWYRKVNAYLWGLLVKSLFGFQVKDVDCAFKLFRRHILDRIELTTDGAIISTEFLAKAHQGKFRFSEVAVTHFPRTAGTPTGANIKVIIKSFVELFKLYPVLKYSKPRPVEMVQEEVLLSTSFD